MNSASITTPSSSGRIRLVAIITSVIGGLFILAIKLYAAHISGSTALRSDALEGTVNVLAAAFGLVALIFSEKPADRDHPYGHGKIEYFASAFEGGLITLAGFLILVDAISRIVHPEPLENLGLGIKINAVAGLLNGLLGVGIYWIGKKHHSEILKADGIHLLTDLLTSVILLLGLGIVLLTGWTGIDIVLAFGIAGFLFFTGYHLVKNSANALLDAEDPALLNHIVDALNQTRHSTPSSDQFKNIITIHDLKAQRFGRDQHIDLHLVMPEFISINEAHQTSDHLSNTLNQALNQASPGNHMIHTHVDPCEKRYCNECIHFQCPIRQSAFEKQKNYTIQNVTETGLT